MVNNTKDPRISTTERQIHPQELKDFLRKSRAAIITVTFTATVITGVMIGISMKEVSNKKKAAVKFKKIPVEEKIRVLEEQREVWVTKRSLLEAKLREVRARKDP